MVNLDDLLPAISIRTDLSPRDFVSRMADIANGIPGIEFRYRRKESSGPAAILSITYKHANKYGLENLYALFAARPWNKERVWVEFSSTTWAVSSPPYDEYVNLAKSLLQPFIISYNKRYRSRRRIYIPSKSDLEPKLSPIISKVFRHFVDSANKSFLHPNDWRIFYTLIRVCHNRKAKLVTEELERLLLKEGFSKYYAEKLSSVYEHGRGILRKEVYPEHIQKIMLSDEYIEMRRNKAKQSIDSDKRRQ